MSGYDLSKALRAYERQAFINFRALLASFILVRRIAPSVGDWRRMPAILD